MNRPAPIFIVGAPRSGTSLLRNLLYSHPRLFFRSETQFIPAFYRVYGNPRSGSEALKLAKKIVKLEWIARWEEDIDIYEMAKQGTFAGLVDNMFMQLALREGKKTWGDKTPHYVLDIHTLREIFPAAKFIHIIRDGRDVCLSQLKANFGPRTIFCASLLIPLFVRRLFWSFAIESQFSLGYRSPMGRPIESFRKIGKNGKKK